MDVEGAEMSPSDDPFRRGPCQGSEQEYQLEGEIRQSAGFQGWARLSGKVKEC